MKDARLTSETKITLVPSSAAVAAAAAMQWFSELSDLSCSNFWGK